MNKSKVLLVEDDEEMCEELVPILTMKGYVVDVAHTGKTGISFLERDGYNIVLLDLKIPGVNGYEVLKYLKNQHPSVKVLVLSGSPLRKEDIPKEDQIFPLDENYETLVSRLADGFINKPFDVDEVLKKIVELTT